MSLRWTPLVVAAALADLVTFGMAVSLHPIAGEWNPLVRYAFTVAGLFGVILLKLGVTAGALMVLRRMTTLRAWGVRIAVGLPIAFAFVNLASIGVIL